MDLKALLKNTNTTAIALVACLVALVQHYFPDLIPPEVMTILIGGIGVLARDGDKTSEQVGLKHHRVQ